MWIGDKTSPGNFWASHHEGDILTHSEMHIQFLLKCNIGTYGCILPPFTFPWILLNPGTTDTCLFAMPLSCQSERIPFLYEGKNAYCLGQMTPLHFTACIQRPPRKDTSCFIFFQTLNTLPHRQWLDPSRVKAPAFNSRKTKSMRQQSKSLPPT